MNAMANSRRCLVPFEPLPVFVGAQFICAMMSSVVQAHKSPSETGLLRDCGRIYRRTLRRLEGVWINDLVPIWSENRVNIESCDAVPVDRHLMRGSR